MRLMTIGGYGFNQRTFIEALRAAHVDTFVDIRQRRGLRGSRYAFLNSTALQTLLAANSIRYLHLRELAPTQAVRDVQKQHDANVGIDKRARTCLSPQFAAAYRTEVLDHFPLAHFRAAVGDNARAVVLFCVEGPAEACHRSLAAAHLAPHFGCEVEDLHP